MEIAELRELILNHIGNSWYVSSPNRSDQVPSILAEIETCSYDRLIEIAQQFSIL